MANGIFILQQAGQQVIISKPEYKWEKHTYAVGLLWADEDDDLLDPGSWNKLPEPVFFTNEKVNRFGPGHNGFTVAEDGVTDIMVYHSREYREIKGHPLYDPNRDTRVRVLHWKDDGFPDFRQEAGD